MTLEEILAFVRDAGDETWNVIIREMSVARKRRAEEAAKSFRIGELDRFQSPDNRSRPLEGRIVKTGRSRVILAVANESGLLERVSVPASMVARAV